jgi:hypothetical protein
MAGNVGRGPLPGMVSSAHKDYGEKPLAYQPILAVGNYAIT